VDAQPSEFDPGGFNTMRIENEIKLVVPLEQTADVWKYLQTRYDNSNLYLRSMDSAFNSKFAEDIFRDQYFDNDTFQLAAMQCGVRHRTRFVLTGAGSNKNGKELMQVKINNIDGNDLNRGEFKYPIRKQAQDKNKKEGDDHVFLGRVKRKNRPDIVAKLKEYGINADELHPTILIVQNRKRVYIARDTTAFATLTLDTDSAFYKGDTVRFTEIEMELNEIAYTLADSATRVEMERINDLMKKDLLEHFPAIHQDQTPKYNKAFTALGIDPKGEKEGESSGFPLMAVLIGAGGLLAILGAWMVLRRRAQERQATTSR
jgi:hypothetical protein